MFDGRFASPRNTRAAPSLRDVVEATAPPRKFDECFACQAREQSESEGPWNARSYKVERSRASRINVPGHWGRDDLQQGEV
jgi:hypothetical protein